MSEGIITRKCSVEKLCAVLFYRQIWNKRTCLDKPFCKCSLCPCLGCCTRMIKSWSMHKPTPMQVALLHNGLLHSTMWVLWVCLVHYETEFWNHETISRKSSISETLELNPGAVKTHMQVDWITYAIGQRRWAVENCANSSELWFNSSKPEQSEVIKWVRNFKC